MIYKQRIRLYTVAVGLCFIFSATMFYLHDSWNRAQAMQFLIDALLVVNALGVFFFGFLLISAIREHARNRPN
jgi:hypothetical protein